LHVMYHRDKVEKTRSAAHTQDSFKMNGAIKKNLYLSCLSHWRFLDRLPRDRLLLTEPRLYSPPSNGRLNVLFCNTKASDSRISSGRIFICVFATLSTSGLTGAKSMLLVISVPSSVIKGLLTTEKS
ncbi:hypothetical protein T06_13566, partial [Trichinella sp. T6]